MLIPQLLFLEEINKLLNKKVTLHLIIAQVMLIIATINYYKNIKM